MVPYRILLLQLLLLFPLLVHAAVAVSIAIYSVLDERDPYHWAIFLDGEKQAILQVGDDIDGVGYFVEAPIYDKSPQRSSRLMESIPLGTLKAFEFATAIGVIQHTPVDNDSKTWNCQAWAIEALDRLSTMTSFEWEAGKRSIMEGKRQHWQ
ncbi:hypothetical protein Cob_v003501 [Colletotrichum orbiculare MAFF 240422]|uniref:Uncharacterized protein n=1 Tax=Colletotrichum orbiculare (strain 104-T / ATCC 96160 / CBS 514.97 / LARS 414 / MAFF 240422) TaxID=1213857 RepID=N4VGV0_COLOR|nr:hypothetical protein Cob_v003501 [Colletotrichum orbiculare MAFF 240422]